MKKTHKGIRLFVAAMLCVMAVGAEAISISSGTPAIGVWNSSYTATRAAADASGTPMVLMWARISCPMCNNAKAAMGQADFLAWQAGVPVFMAIAHSTDSDNQAALNLIQSDRTLVNLPLFCVYWKRPDGSTFVRSFVGRDRDSTLTVRTGSLGMQSAGTVDAALAASGWSPVPPYSGGYFTVHNSENARLEAEPSTDVVHVPLVRTASTAFNQTVTVQYPDGAVETIAVPWVDGELAKTVAISGIAAHYAVGAAATLILRDEDDSEVDVSAITFVPAKGNSVDNPYFIGERTADTLAAGEWTMDLDVALGRAASVGGLVLALVDGSLWCPYCEGASQNLFGTATFTGWASSRNLSLVQIDTARIVNGAPTRSPTLLTHEEHNGKSGSAYLSRKSIAPDAAESIYARNISLTYSVWKELDSSAYRVSQPHVLILDKDGTVLSRSGLYPGTQKDYPADVNLKRLEELLVAAGDETNRRDAYPATTTLEVGTNAPVAGAVSAVTKRAFRLTEATKGLRITVAMQSESSGLALDILHVADGVCTVLASASGSALLTVAANVPAHGACYARVKPTTALLSSPADDTGTAFTIMSSAEPAPVVVEDPGKFVSDFVAVAGRGSLKLSGVAMDASGRITGTVALTIAPKGRATCKYTGFAGNANFSIKSWASSEHGTVVAGAKDSRNRTISLELGEEGVTGSIYDPASGGAIQLVFGAYPWSASRPATPFMGQYAVALVSDGGGYVSGNGYLTLTMNAGSSRTGKVSYKGMLPTGQSLNGNAVLLAPADGSSALLPIIKKSSRDTVAGVISIPANAAATYKTNPRVINGDMLEWRHTERSAAASFTRQLKAYGVYYSGSDNLTACCIEHYGSSVLPFDVGTDALAGKTSYGTAAVAPVANVTVWPSSITVDSSDVRISFKKNTGVYSGSFKILFGEKKVSAKFAGVLIPGWSDCGCTSTGETVLPFGTGACWFSDKVGGASVKSGCRANIGKVGE